MAVKNSLDKSGGDGGGGTKGLDKSPSRTIINLEFQKHPQLNHESSRRNTGGLSPSKAPGPKQPPEIAVINLNPGSPLAS